MDYTYEGKRRILENAIWYRKKDLFLVVSLKLLCNANIASVVGGSIKGSISCIKSGETFRQALHV